jgi:hypothetical protein
MYSTTNKCGVNNFLKSPLTNISSFDMVLLRAITDVFLQLLEEG